MASLAITSAQLFGAQSIVNAGPRKKIVSAQEFNFPGLQNDNAFRQAIGGRGEIWTFSGLLRSTAQSTIAAAADNLNTILNGSTTGDPTAPAVTDGIHFFMRYQILLKFMASDTTNFSVLYQGTGTAGGIDNMVIPDDGFQLGPRELAREGANYRAIQPFQMTMRRLGVA